MNTDIVLVKEKENMWFAGSLKFPNVTTGGDTREEAKKNLQLIVGGMLLHGELDLSSKEVDDEVYVKDIYGQKMEYILAEINLKDYLQIDEPGKSVRTNVSIKQGYKILAKAKNLNMSDFINKALSKELKVEF